MSLCIPHRCSHPHGVSNEYIQPDRTLLSCLYFWRQDPLDAISDVGEENVAVVGCHENPIMMMTTVVVVVMVMLENSTSRVHRYERQHYCRVAQYPSACPCSVHFQHRDGNGHDDHHDACQLDDMGGCVAVALVLVALVAVVVAEVLVALVVDDDVDDEQSW